MKHKTRKIFTVGVFLLVAALYIFNLVENTWPTVLLIVVGAGIAAAFANLIWRLFAFLNDREKGTES